MLVIPFGTGCGMLPRQNNLVFRRHKCKNSSELQHRVEMDFMLVNTVAINEQSPYESPKVDLLIWYRH